MEIAVGDRVKITKTKRAKVWKVLGILRPLPFMERGVKMQYLLASRNKTVYVHPNQIMEILK